METPQSTAAEQIPVERLCYPYAPMNATFGRHLLIYAGAPLSLGAVEPMPANATPFAPPKFIPPGMAAYWNGFGWCVMNDLRPSTLDQLKRVCLQALDDRFTINTESLTRGYTKAEIFTWAAQEADARIYLETGRATNMLRQLAAANTYTIELLCARIVAKADAFREHYSGLLAQYQATQKKIETTATKEGLPAISVEDLQRTSGTFQIPTMGG